MTNLTIQLEFEFPATVSGLYEAMDLLEFFVCRSFPVSSLIAYNNVFKAIHFCRKNETISLSAFLELQARLVSYHCDVLALNGVR